MAKFLVKQSLREKTEIERDHLKPLRAIVERSLGESETIPARWLWGHTEIGTGDYWMLFEADDEPTVREQLREVPHIVSINRVFYVDPTNVLQRMGYAS